MKMGVTYVSDGTLYIDDKPISTPNRVIQFSRFCKYIAIVDDQHNVWSYTNNELRQITDDNNSAAVFVFENFDITWTSLTGEAFLMSEELGGVRKITGLKAPLAKLGSLLLLDTMGQMYNLAGCDACAANYGFIVTDCTTCCYDCVIGYDDQGNKMTDVLGPDDGVILGCNSCEYWTSTGNIYCDGQVSPALIGVPDAENIISVNVYHKHILILYNTRRLLVYRNQEITQTIENVECISDYIPRTKRNTKSANM